MHRILLIFLLVFGTIAAGHAQKMGHVNFGNLLSIMPATETADKEMEAYQKQLIAERDKMMQALENAFGEAQAKQATTPPVEMQKIREKLQQDEQAIAMVDQQLPAKLEERRRQLLGPIIEKAKAAIEEVAREGGYTFVFDSSLFNTLLYTEEGTDLLPLVKAKLGL